MAFSSRRRTLALTGTALISLAGCLGDPLAGSSDGARTTPPEYDCATADRPEPDELDADSSDTESTDEDAGAVEPTAYPTRPASLSDDEEAAEYVQAYERAYRRNALVERWGDDLTEQSTWIEGVRTYDAPEGAAVVRVQYTYSETVEESDGTEIIGDSPTVYASYYVDDSVVIRAVDTGLRDDERALDPDPWETGEPLECFG